MANAKIHPPSILKLDPTPFRTPILPFAACRLYSDGESPHVHFPPTPGLAVTYPADSPRTYDRKPIVVSPNVVQLPPRDARNLRSPPVNYNHRGRTRDRTPHGWRRSRIESYFHPRAYEACSPESIAGEFALPPLVEDLSPSDESDDSITTPPHAMRPMPQSISQSISVQLPDVPPKVRRAQDRNPAYRRESPPLMLASLPYASPPSPSCLFQGAQRLSREEESFSSAFSPAQDEGCLGGF